MNQDELEKSVNKKILGFAAEMADKYYIFLQLNYGKRMIFESEAPIRVSVETEQ